MHITPHLRAELMSGPLMIEPGFLASVTDQPQASWFTGSYDQKSRVNVTDDGIAAIRVHGLLVNRGAWLGQIYGMTSYEGLAEQIKRCAADDQIKHIVLDIDSGGGMVAGIWDLMPVIEGAKSSKPVTAIANAWACSAAYAIGSAAGAFHVNRSSTTGSIGVIRPHMDMSKALSDWGVKATFFTAGRMKAAGNPYEPLTAEVKDYIQAGVDEAYERFVGHVAGARKMSPEAVKATEAKIFGPEDAVSLGLADSVLSFEELIDQIRVRASSPARSRASQKGNSMSNNAGAASLSAADIAAIAAAVAPTKPADGTVTKAEAQQMASDAAAAAVKADRDRTAAILAHAEAKGREEAAIKLASKGMSVEDAADVLASLPKAAPAATTPSNPLRTVMPTPGMSANIRPEGGSATGGAQTVSLADKFAAKHESRRGARARDRR
jgi:signal peptide peptidase SppA